MTQLIIQMTVQETAHLALCLQPPLKLCMFGKDLTSESGKTTWHGGAVACLVSVPFVASQNAWKVCLCCNSDAEQSSKLCSPLRRTVFLKSALSNKMQVEDFNARARNRIWSLASHWVKPDAAHQMNVASPIKRSPKDGQV